MISCDSAALLDMSRVAVIGRGSIGQRHAAVFTERLGTGSVALYPAGVREAESVADIVERVLEFSPSHAVIAAPAHRHLDFADAFLATSIHCLIEKPLCAQPTHAGPWLQQLAPNVPVWIGYNLHYRPEYAFLRQHLPSLGLLHWAEFRCGQALSQWRPGRELANSVTLRPDWGGGVLRELSHELEMAISLLGPLSVRSVVAQTGVYGTEVEEAVQADLITAQGCPVSLSVDLYRIEPERRVFLVGEFGQLMVDFIAARASWVVNGEQQSIDFASLDSYGVQADQFLAGERQSLQPRIEDAVATMALIGELEQRIDLEL